MKERFKFRVWLNKLNRYSKNTDNLLLSEDGNVCEFDTVGCYSEKDVVIQQCTGLKDKNGKLIYEGDLLRYPAKDKYEQENYACLEVFFHDNDCCDNHIGFQLGRVHFHGCLCGMSFGSKYKFIPKNANEMEIIGNIYQNKELLGEKK